MYKINKIHISKIKNYERNPRNNALAIDKVKASIVQFGFLFPVVIDLNYVIVCGHTRVQACKEIGVTEIPCITAHNLTPEQVDFFRLVDNKTSEYACWDLDKLKMELERVNLNLETNRLILSTFDLNLEMMSLDIDTPEIPVEAIDFSDGAHPHQRIAVPNEPIQRDSSQSDEEQEQDYYPYECDVSDSVHGDCTEIASGGQPCFSGKTKALYFRFGDVKFFISDRELERLNSTYAIYMNEIYPSMTFVQYLLEGQS